jgi:hypothetical protein
MGNQFYYMNDKSEVTGPCTTLQLMALQKSGQITDSSLVCAEGTDAWVELWSVFPASRIRGSKSAGASKAGSPASNEAINAPAAENATTPPPATMVPANIRPATSSQAALIILLLLVALALPYIAPLRPVPTWEYKRVVFPSNGEGRIGPGALRYSTVPLDEKLLSQLGAEGWEMVGTYLEMETAFPNLDENERPKSFQSNVRPQSLTVLFKRPAR